MICPIQFVRLLEKSSLAHIQSSTSAALLYMQKYSNYIHQMHGLIAPFQDHYTLVPGLHIDHHPYLQTNTIYQM